jgi:hypothetical protein
VQQCERWFFDKSAKPLVMKEWPDPLAGPGEVLVQVEACGICRTDLHVIDGDPRGQSLQRARRRGGADLRTAVLICVNRDIAKHAKCHIPAGSMAVS